MAILDTLEHAAQEAPLEPIETCEAKIRAWAVAHPHDAEWGGGAGKVSWLIGRWGADNKFAIGGGVYVHVSKADGAVTVWGGPFHVGNVQVGVPWRAMARHACAQTGGGTGREWAVVAARHVPGRRQERIRG